MTTAAVVPAAGRGDRLGAAVPKALVRLGDATLLELSVATLAPLVDLVVVAGPAEVTAEMQRLVGDATVVAGGATRQESVRTALDVLPDEVDVVLVHDAARALVPADVVVRVLGALRAGAAAVVPVVPLADTVKEVDAAGAVSRTVDRSRLRAVQTPQGFRRDVLARAHAAATAAATDDAALVEALGVQVVTVDGSPQALKVTTPFDLVVARALLAQRASERSARV